MRLSIGDIRFRSLGGVMPETAFKAIQHAVYRRGLILKRTTFCGGIRDFNVNVFPRMLIHHTAETNNKNFRDESFAK